jgi:hypothetical protein
MGSESLDREKMSTLETAKKAVQWGGVIVAALWVVYGALKATRAIAVESKKFRDEMQSLPRSG